MSETSSAELRAVLLKSPRWQAFCERLPVMAMADIEPLKPENWTEYERIEVVAWAHGTRDTLPQPLVDYSVKVQAAERKRS